MSKPTPNTRADAIVRVVEDVIVVAGTGCTTWLATHNLDDTLGAVAAAPLVRSGVAAALSSGRVSGLVLALKLVRQALGYLDTASSTSPGTVSVTPVLTAPTAAAAVPAPDPAPAPVPPVTS